MRGRKRRGLMVCTSSFSSSHYSLLFFSRKIKHSFYLEKFEARLFTHYSNLFLHAPCIFIVTFESTEGRKRPDALPAGLLLVTVTGVWRTRNTARGRACLAQTTAQRQNKQTKKIGNINYVLEKGVQLMITADAALFIHTQKLVSPHLVFNLENPVSLVWKNLF